MDLGIPGVGPGSEIGRGPFGTVYRCAQAQHHRDVAVKVLDTAQPTDKELARLRQGLRSLAALRGDPGVVDVFGGGVAAGHLYLVEEYLTNGSADDRLIVAPLAWKGVVALGDRIATTLAAAHNARVVHGDLKPSNVLFDNVGNVKIADFGVAHISGLDPAAPERLRLTVAHAAPEILRGEEATFASDSYSLASTLITLARGRPPYVARPGESVRDTLPRIFNAAPPELTSLGFPAPIAVVILSALSRVPKERPDARTIVDQLHQAADDVGMSWPEANSEALRWLANPGAPPALGTGKSAGAAKEVQSSPALTAPSGDTPDATGYIEQAPRRGWRPRSKHRLIALGSACLVVVAALALVLLLRHGAASTSGPGRASASANPATAGVPVGWHLVVSRNNLNYYAPPNWRVVPGELVGWGDDPGACALAGTPLPSFCAPGATPDTVLLHATAQDVNSNCHGSDAADTGVIASSDSDSERAAKALAAKAAALAYRNNNENPAVTVDAPSKITVAGVNGSSVVAHVSAIASAPCAPPAALVEVVALPATGGMVFFVAVADQGVSGDATPAQLQQIVSTLRIVHALVVS